MFAKWKRSLRAFRESPPGERFVRRYRAHRGSGKPAARIALVAVGLVLIAGGAILLVIPGPGLLVIAFGGALVAQESLWTAKALDWLELVLRRLHRSGGRFWKNASSLVRAMVVAAALLGAVAVAYLGYLWLFQS